MQAATRSTAGGLADSGEGTRGVLAPNHAASEAEIFTVYTSSSKPIAGAEQLEGGNTVRAARIAANPAAHRGQGCRTG